MLEIIHIRVAEDFAIPLQKHPPNIYWQRNNNSGLYNHSAVENWYFSPVTEEETSESQKKQKNLLVSFLVFISF